MSEARRGKLHAVLKSSFGLDDRITARLIDDAAATDRSAIDLYHFTVNSIIFSMKAGAASLRQRMPGFADVMDKVKPAVISVRVKLDDAKMMSFDGNSPFLPSSPAERFFRRFGMPSATTRRTASANRMIIP